MTSTFEQGPTTGTTTRVVCPEFGPSDRLTVVDVPTPVPGAGEVLIEAAAVSFVDDLIVAGRYQLRPPLPFTPGSVVAGRIVAVGDGVGVAPGTDVVGLALGFGGYASHVVLAEAQVVARPSAVSAPVAAAAIESHSTLVFAVTQRVRIAPGEWVVVLGAGAGIGLATVDVATSLGARVVAVASSAARRAAATAAGARTAVDNTDLENTIRAVIGVGPTSSSSDTGRPPATGRR